MDGNRGLRLGLSDFAIRLDLIAKVRGISSAENYFKDLPEKAKNQKTYGALLNSYIGNKLTEKAEGLMVKIKESGFALKALPYNNMMTLYRALGQPEKVLSLIQDMKVDNILPDSFTYKIWMNSCADLSDIDGVEKVLDELKHDGRFKYDWSIYSNLSAIYIKEGLIKKAQDALKETEHKIFMKKDRDAYKSLIIMHSKLVDKPKVYSVWKKFARVFPKRTNTDYICMLTALVKLGDIKGVEKCLKGWEYDGLSYDIRVPNVLIGAYLR
ncbi:large ribosomal subunit protein mL101 (rPPR4)-like [Cryptomeria japonica]|uniref:large ribosomal subunit protein mL101 (rPPR4)-like n=1 Tax=Cryptomeria japonica TaxID=3369 RepID=UPI0027DAAF0C|nr:large ribosomal subunit protein mL101 (rPPR4)-like [Cryptomeria japonica]